VRGHLGLDALPEGCLDAAYPSRCEPAAARNRAHQTPIRSRRTSHPSVRVVAELCRWVFNGHPVGWTHTEHMQIASIVRGRVCQKRTVLDLIASIYGG
jgi:hypothetical protein